VCPWGIDVGNACRLSRSVWSAGWWIVHGVGGFLCVNVDHVRGMLGL
jgi:hypothetical protein